MCVVLVLLATGLVALWWQADALYDDTGVSAGDQAAATATTRAGILAVFAATIAAVAATVALAETRRANLAAHERDREADQRERYTKAIDQLGTTGDEQVDVRLGGIYALQRLAQDSDRDHPTVVEVLCAFVRGHGQGPEDETAILHGSHRPPPDVQAALTVIKRVHNRDRGSYIDLREGHLERSVLADGNLSDADLGLAKLQVAILTGANLSGAFLNAADLRGATLEDANLAHANLAHANLTGANITPANLSDANLNNTILSDANLSGANLDGATLADANLSGANLGMAVGLTQDQVLGARGDERTLLPDGLTPPGHWMPPPNGSGASDGDGGDSG